MMVHKRKHSLKVISFYTKDDSEASDPAWWATHIENLNVKTFTSQVADVVVIGQWVKVGAWPLWQHCYL